MATAAGSGQCSRMAEILFAAGASADQISSKERNMKTHAPAVAAIQFALETDDGLSFLRCWNEGNFDAIRHEWPEAPEAVFIGADPLHPATTA